MLTLEEQINRIYLGTGSAQCAALLEQIQARFRKDAATIRRLEGELEDLYAGRVPLVITPPDGGPQ